MIWCRTQNAQHQSFILEGLPQEQGGTKLTRRELSACTLLLVVPSQVISEQFAAGVKQNGFQLFSAPLFHTVKLLELFVGVCVLMGLNFPQEVQNAVGFGGISCPSGSSCTLQHPADVRLCRREWYPVIWCPDWITSFQVGIILEVEVSWCSRLENTFSSRQIAGPMYAAVWAAGSATGWLKSILQSLCHHLWDVYGFRTGFQTTRSCCYFYLSHPLMDADLTNSWPNASRNSQINMKLLHVPFGYLNAAYCSVALSFHELAWCSISNVIFWMLCWKRLFKGAHWKINAVLYRCCKLPLQISVADSFPSWILECLRPMCLLKIHHKKTQGEKT